MIGISGKTRSDANFAAFLMLSFHIEDCSSTRSRGWQKSIETICLYLPMIETSSRLGVNDGQTVFFTIF